MTPVIHCSIGNISLFPLGSLRTCREIQPRKFCVSEKSRLASSSCQMLLLPQPALRFIGVYNRSWGSSPRRRTQVVAAVETDVTVEEPNPAPSGKVGDESSGASTTSVEASEPVEAATTTTKIRRKRPGRKSEMPPVKEEELVPGASFTGKVRAIQPFGLFVDFGAFTDGLVHISRVSDGFTKDVASLFTVGQEVTVRIVEADKETGRISLTMRSSDDATKVKPTTPHGENNRTAPRSPSRLNTRQKEAQKSSKFVKGQQLNGTVKNLTRSGSFVSLPDGEEGFLPVAEESEGFGAALGNSSLQVGQEVSVRVLRIARGQVTLTMKKEQDVEGLKKKLGQGIEHTATNPFQLAFRRNKEISAFLDGREKAQKSSEKLGISKASEAPVTAAVVESVTDSATSSDQLEDKVSESESLEVDSSTTTTEEPEVENAVDDKLDEPSATDFITEEEDSPSSAALVDEDASKDEASRRDLSSPSSSTVDESPELQSAAFVDEAAQEDSSDSSSDSVVSEISVPEETEDSTVVTDTVEDQALNLNSPISEGDESSSNSTPESSNADLVSETEDRDSVVSEISVPEETKDSTAVTDTVEDQALNSNTPVSEGDESSSNSTPESSSADLVSETEDKPAEPEVSSLSESSAAEAAPVTDEAKEADVAVAALSSSAEDALVSDSQQATIPEIAASNQPEDKITNGNVEKKTAVPVEKEANAAENGSADQGSSVKATISAALVKQLREETGAGMMDCKKALAESGGDLVKAQEFLRKKGLASADKKAGRATSEGRIGSYIHDNSIGVLIEVNCETDFVSRGEIFKELVDDLAMQVAACPQVKYLSTEDIPEEIVNKEKEIEMQKEDLLSKPEQIRSKIVEGRVRKRLAEVALLEQPYIKNDKVVVKDWVKQTIATIGENMKVRRFVRYNLGEGLEKKSQDFAAEVAAQTAAKPAPSVPKDKPAEETTVNVEKKPTVSISPALVKQLREETGAGMMDCKKALSETGGDLEKAQEYLRKKGLSSADKKSSRLTAEGLVSSYIHDSRIGCLIEVNSETDFVARNEKFKELVNDLAMQVVACPQVEYVSVEDIPESMISKEKEIEMQREDLQSKPENIRERIVEGRISKRLGELALLEQPFIKDDSKTVKDLVKETIAALGENIKVRRFVRYTLGENKE